MVGQRPDSAPPVQQGALFLVSSFPDPLESSQALSEAPYLNHRERHHGQLTLSPPENLGRRRQEKSSKPKRKKGSKYEVPQSVVDAVARAGLPAAATTRVQPSAAASTSQASLIATSNEASRAASPATTRSGRRRRQLGGNANTSNLSLPLVSRGPSQVSVAESSASVPEETIAPEEQIDDDDGALPQRRIDIWAGIEDNAEEPPPVWTAPERPPIPNSPPPTYRSPSPESRASSPEAEQAQPSAAQRLWEEDRAAGFSLSDRLERERARRRDSLQRLQDESAPLLHKSRRSEEPTVPVTLLLAPEPIKEEEPERPSTPVSAAFVASVPSTPVAAPMSPSLAQALQGSSPFPSPKLESAEADPLATPSLKSQLMSSPPSSRIIDRPRPRLKTRLSSSPEHNRARSLPVNSPNATQAVAGPSGSAPSSPIIDRAQPEPSVTQSEAIEVVTSEAQASVVPLLEQAVVTTSPEQSPVRSLPALPPRVILPKAPPPLMRDAASAVTAVNLFQSRFAVPQAPAAQTASPASAMPAEQWRAPDEPVQPVKQASWEQKWEEWDEDTPLVGPSSRPYDPEARRRREGHRASMILSRPMSVKRKPPPVPPPRRSWVPPIVVPEEESLSSLSAGESSSGTAPPRPSSSALTYIPGRVAASLPQPIAPEPRRQNVSSIVDTFEAATRRRPPPVPSKSPLQGAARSEPKSAPIRTARSLPRPPIDRPTTVERPPDHVLRQLAIGIRMPPAPSRPAPPVPIEEADTPQIEVTEAGEGSFEDEGSNESMAGAASGPIEGQQEPQAELSQWTDLDLLAARHTRDPSPNPEDQEESHYEPLLLLGEVLGPPPPRPTEAERARVSMATIELVRRRVRADGKVMLRLACAGISVTRCTVCQIQFRDKDEAAIFPGCAHVFHLACLTSWLSRSRVCPFCRKDIADES